MTSARPESQANDLIEKFAGGPTVAHRTEALTELLARRILPKAAKSSQVSRGLHGLLESFKFDADPATRLGALAQLVRLAQSARSISAEIEKAVAPSLAEPIPPASLLKDADARFYVAKACGWSKADWVLSYAIDSAGSEPPSADKVRAEFMSVVFSRATSLSDIFARLTESVSSQRPDTEAPANSMAKRLARIVDSLRAGILGTLLPPGQKVGECLADLARRPLAPLGRPSDESASIALARAVIGCVHDLVRTRFSLSTEPATYSAVRTAKRLFEGSAWPTELREELELVAASTIEAILMLAKQGISARQLLDQLDTILGSRERSTARLRELAAQHPEIPEAVRDWLKGTVSVQSIGESTALSESRDLRVDPAIGQALFDSRRARQASRGVETDVIPALMLYDPSQAEALRTFLTRSDRMADAIEDLAKQRRIGLFGNPGEEVIFAAKYFESADGAAGERVRVVRPAIVRLAEDGTPGEPILKGLVE
jgi:hypothetical protein